MCTQAAASSRRFPPRHFNSEFFQSYSVEIRRPLQPPVLTTWQITSCRGRVGKPLKKEVTQFNCFLIEEKTIIENASCRYNNDHHYSTDPGAVASVSPFDLRDCGGLLHGECHKQSTRAIDSPPPPLPPLLLLPACHRYCKSIPSILLTRRVLTRTHTHFTKPALIAFEILTVVYRAAHFFLHQALPIEIRPNRYSTLRGSFCGGTGIVWSSPCPPLQREPTCVCASGGLGVYIVACRYYILCSWTGRTSIHFHSCSAPFLVRLVYMWRLLEIQEALSRSMIGNGEHNS